MPQNTGNRVARNTREEVNLAIRQNTFESVRKMLHASPQRLRQRLSELDKEWDLERVLEANAASVILLGLGLSHGLGKRWMILPGAAAGFLLMHAVRGWCPPLPFWRKMGVRTAEEIDEERYALKFLEGDFENLDKVTDSNLQDLLRAVSH